MRQYILNILKLKEKGHAYLKDLFEFPDYYGNNLDALYDCLSEMEAAYVEVINYHYVDAFGLKVLDVLNDVSDDYQKLIIHIH